MIARGSTGTEFAYTAKHGVVKATRERIRKCDITREELIYVPRAREHVAMWTLNAVGAYSLRRVFSTPNPASAFLSCPMRAPEGFALTTSSLRRTNGRNKIHLLSSTAERPHERTPYPVFEHLQSCRHSRGICSLPRIRRRLLGESIDILNGNLNFAIPIGPKFQVNKNLSCQLQLVHNSRIWEFHGTYYDKD